MIGCQSRADILSISLELLEGRGFVAERGNRLSHRRHRFAKRRHGVVAMQRECVERRAYAVRKLQKCFDFIRRVGLAADPFAEHNRAQQSTAREHRQRQRAAQRAAIAMRIERLGAML